MPKRTTLEPSDYHTIFDSCFLITLPLTNEARAYHAVINAQAQAERDGRDLSWLCVSKESIFASILGKMGYILNPITITNPGNIHMLSPQKSTNKTISQIRVGSRNRKIAQSNYLTFLEMFRLVEVPLSPREKKQAGIRTIYGVERQLLNDLRKRTFDGKRKRGDTSETLSEKIDHISSFATKDILNFISRNPEHPRIYNELTSKPERGKPSIKREDRAAYLYDISNKAKLIEVDYRCSNPQYIAREAGCTLILDSIKRGDFYPLEKRAEMKSNILTAIGSRFSDKIAKSTGYGRLSWLAKWLSERFGESEAQKFIAKLLEIKSIHELYSYERHQRDFCRTHPNGTINIHDGIIFAGWDETAIRQLTNELDADKCASGMGILYSVKEITPGHERDLTDEWTRQKD